MTDTILRKKDTPPTAYPIEVVIDVISGALKEFSRRKLTGRITPEIDISQGGISDFFMGQRARVKRKQ